MLLITRYSFRTSISRTLSAEYEDYTGMREKALSIDASLTAKIPPNFYKEGANS
jgi:hypothetical protein